MSKLKTLLKEEREKKLTVKTDLWDKHIYIGANTHIFYMFNFIDKYIINKLRSIITQQK